jgi:tellurite resistance protein TehA-like permease
MTHRGEGRPLPERVPLHHRAQAVRDLRPDSYAVVMATGIVAIAASQAGMAWVSWGLSQIAQAAYAVVWLFTLARLIFAGRRMIEDLRSPTRCAGFLTVVAATCVLGSQVLILSGDRRAAASLWVLGAGLWLLLMYTVFAAAIVRHPKPALTAGLDGSWLMAVVATQSLSVLGTLIAPGWGLAQPPGLFVTLNLYLLGCMLYVPIIVVILYRLLFLPLAPAALSPTYWINMGAVAISTLAGALLIAAAPQSAVLHEILPVLRAVTLSLWTLGTWWIPLLVILGVWRHLGRRVPLTYEFGYWSMVFPLGMYTACSFELARVTGIPLFRDIAGGFIYAALAAWVWAFAGLLRTMARGRVMPARGAADRVR